MNTTEDGDQPLGEYPAWPDGSVRTVGEAYLSITCNFRGLSPEITEKIGRAAEVGRGLPPPRPPIDWRRYVVLASISVLWFTGLLWFLSVTASPGWQPW